VRVERLDGYFCEDRQHRLSNGAKMSQQPVVDVLGMRAWSAGHLGRRQYFWARPKKMGRAKRITSRPRVQSPKRTSTTTTAQLSGHNCSSYQVLSLEKAPNPLDAERGENTNTPTVADADKS